MSTILSNWLPLAAAVAGAALLLVLVARVIRVARRASRARIVTVGLLIPAAMALSLSASTSYRYVGGQLGITDLIERLALCATVEAAIIALTVHSWGAKSKGSALIAYAMVAVQAIPAFAVSGGAGGLFRIVAGPVLLALLLHKLLGLEMKFSGQKSTGLLASLGREIRERLTALLGIGQRGADSAEIARNRAADRAVRLASKRSLRRFAAARLSKAIDAAQHGLDGAGAATAEASIVARIVRRKSVADLHSLTDRHVWSASATAAGTPSGIPGNQVQNVPGNVPEARTSTAPRHVPGTVPGAGQGPIALPQARRTRKPPAPVPGGRPDVPEYTDETALRARALEIDEESVATTGRPAGIRPLREGLSIGSGKATEIRDWLAAQREQLDSVTHANGTDQV